MVIWFIDNERYITSNTPNRQYRMYEFIMWDFLNMGMC